MFLAAIKYRAANGMAEEAEVSQTQGAMLNLPSILRPCANLFPFSSAEMAHRLEARATWDGRSCSLQMRAKGKKSKTDGQLREPVVPVAHYAACSAA